MIPTQRKNSGKLSKSLQLKKIAALVGGEVYGNADISITGVAGIREARKGDITFLANPKYLSYLEETEASAVITSPEVISQKKPLVRTANPSGAFTKIVAFFTPSRTSQLPGIHPSAVVDPSVILGADLTIGPHVVIEKNCEIGDRSVIDAGSYMGARSSLGSDVRIYPNVIVGEGTILGNRVVIHSGTVIGSDGYGYENVNDEYVK
ncbi:MAG: UDP-3-O-(3-hydroxymyristoyl)glucosamine N-acyltransferase, partial [Candidatus Omnitrophica bacterium CG07_land_8_20_14_0_80_50_8]